MTLIQVRPDHPYALRVEGPRVGPTPGQSTAYVAFRPDRPGR